MIFGLALAFGLAYGFCADEKKAPAATPVGETAISAHADADCDKAKADCPKGSAACAKAHAGDKSGKHAAADCPKGADCPKAGQCEKHKAGEAKAVPEKTGAVKPGAKPAETAKPESHPG
ncbi:MAG: hypothetical protein JWO30_1458 [Fibrobacteres bacterium]|nr:hypothetical protein [Fibrobacterota bacterium]